MHSMLDDNYGMCCVCEAPNADPNFFQMDYKVPETVETKWGCLKCGLPIEGAIAVVCDGCLRKHGPDAIDDHIKFLMDGRDRRIPVPPPEERIPHDHDYTKHPEVNYESEIIDNDFDDEGGWHAFWKEIADEAEKDL